MEESLFGRYEYCINSYLTDCKRQASLQALFLLAQECGWKHAEHHGFGWDALAKNEWFWVLSRIKMRILEYPQWRDNVIVETWSKQPDTLMAYRDFEMFADNGTKILTATSAWLILNKDRRPQRMSTMSGLFPLMDKNAMDGALVKLPRHDVGKTVVYSIKTIPYSAIDMNGHVNNTIYLQWVIDEFSENYIMNHEVFEVEINYLQESVIGQQYYVLMEECCTDEYLCSVVRHPDNKELAKMNLKFRNKMSVLK